MHSDVFWVFFKHESKNHRVSFYNWNSYQSCIQIMGDTAAKVRKTFLCCFVGLFSTCWHTHLVQILYVNCITNYQVLNWGPADQTQPVSTALTFWYFSNVVKSFMSYFEPIICGVFASDLIYHINCPSWIVFYLITSTRTHQTSLFF